MAKTILTIREIARASVKMERSHNVPAELIAAQCAIESGWLSFVPANNCFGIKYYQGAFGKQLLPTHEWFSDATLKAFLNGMEGRTAQLDPHFTEPDEKGRKNYIVLDWFATFPTMAACFKKRAELFDKGAYAAWTTGWRTKQWSLETLVRGIAPIYASGPAYANLVWRICNDPGLKTAITLERTRPQ